MLVETYNSNKTHRSNIEIQHDFELFLKHHRVKLNTLRQSKRFAPVQNPRHLGLLLLFYRKLNNTEKQLLKYRIDFYKENPTLQISEKPYNLALAVHKCSEQKLI